MEWRDLQDKNTDLTKKKHEKCDLRKIKTVFSPYFYLVFFLAFFIFHVLLYNIRRPFPKISFWFHWHFNTSQRFHLQKNLKKNSIVHILLYISFVKILDIFLLIDHSHCFNTEVSDFHTECSDVLPYQTQQCIKCIGECIFHVYSSSKEEIYRFSQFLMPMWPFLAIGHS